jgi:hypothetical protein
MATKIFVVKSLLRDYYVCDGPDGQQFSDTSLEGLREILRRQYGDVELEVIG